MPAAAYLVETLQAPQDWGRLGQNTYHLVVAVAGLIAIALIAADAIVNNWSINNYLGNGYFFVTPVAAALDLPQLLTQYAFASDLSIPNLSTTGFWLANITVSQLVAKSEDIYVISAGTFPLTPAMTLCPIFQKTYLGVHNPTNVRLALASDAVSYYRGNAISHAFTSDTTNRVGNATMRSTELEALGYLPGRNTVDMRFTHEIPLRNVSTPQTLAVNYFRIYPRNFCTGCDPVAELGYGVCNMTLVYNESAQSVTVTSSTFVDGSVYNLGLMMINSTFGVIALYVKLLGIFFAVGGYLASRRTVQWQEVDMTKSNSLVSRIVRTVAPKYFPHASHALRYDMFCYNSDIFVFSYAISVVLDIQNCLIFVRNVNLYNDLSPQLLYSLQMFCCSMRLLWINCAVLKVCKILWNLLGTVSFNGQSVVMGYLNLSSVSWLYLSAVLLVYIPRFIDYNNSVVVDVRNSFQRIDGLRVDIFYSFYFRVVGSIVLGILANLAVITALDHAVNARYWKLLRKHSLARQALYNSSSIVCDYLDGIEVEPEAKEKGAVLICRARRLSTLQWFFMSHLTCFGLPEKELRQKKQTIIMVKSKATTRSVTSDKTLPFTAARDPSVGNDDLRDTSYMVVQDGDANIHLIDGVLSDVTSLVYNIKILKNTSMTLK